ncbi:alpha/beta fold hydrolase [Paracoccus spongiarum]|uniref:Alpha/beta hydrolase n=1 Tax=Paracoccus spongiarum TaxID=3064387 RepID=A0ABT9JDT9_9RHOB|nr:alpha/beta hydrolase [Paracoccus sp. 2205BS29-5]MDP5307990.1 alpha/beta hydrolase [Paracoccus sp. 2205BS29-5]
MTEAAPFHQLPGDARRPARAFWARAEDGVRLRMACWDGGDGTAGSILLFPGRTEYIEKYAPIAQLLNAEGYDVLAIDWRGQGLSDRLQDDPRPGHVNDFADYQRDVVEMVVAATELDLPRPWHLLAHSMGGCIGLAALHADLPVATAVFSAPMWGVNLRQMPHGVALGIAYLAGRLGHGGRSAPGSGAVGAYMLDEAFSANLLTGDAEEWCRLLREAAAWPDLTIGGASYHWVSRALNECSRLDRLGSPDLPMTVSLGSEEKVVSAAAIRSRTARWPNARLLEIEGARHEVMMEAAPLRDMFLSAALERFRDG